MSDGSDASRRPPAFAPPERVDPQTSEYTLAVDVTAALGSHSRCLRERCWKATSLSPFGPERMETTEYRSRVTVPETLRARGVDQEEFDAMLEDVKSGLADATPAVSPLCAFAAAFTIVLFPFAWCFVCAHVCSSDELRERAAVAIERAMEARGERWLTRHRVKASVRRDVQYKRPYIPAEDALWGFKSMPIQSSTWVGIVLSFAPVESEYSAPTPVEHP